jgi:hypothetical protein
MLTVPVAVKLAQVAVPVKLGEAVLAFKPSAEEVAVDTGLLASEVLSTFPSPTMAFVIPETVPVKVGDAVSAFNPRAAEVAVETGLFASEVLSTFPNPRSAFVTKTP